MAGIWEGTIYDDTPKTWGDNNNIGAIGSTINDNVNNQPTYGAISGAIDNYVNSPSGGVGFAQNFGNNLLNNFGGGGGFSGSTAGSQKPSLSFHPTMTQAQFLNADFQNQPSYLANIGQGNNRNLYNYLMR